MRGQLDFLPADGPAFSREWGMPNRDTFSVNPIGAFVQRYLANSQSSVDPFARDKRWATATNDLNPATAAEYHMDAEAFCLEMARQGRRFDLAIFDPPYSPRQISECYKGIGIAVDTKETQNAVLYKRVRDAMAPILTDNAIVLSFGWNSNGMGVTRGYRIMEVMLVAHGGAHNDTICIAERRDSGRHSKSRDRRARAEGCQSGPAKTGHRPNHRSNPLPQDSPSMTDRGSLTDLLLEFRSRLERMVAEEAHRSGEEMPDTLPAAQLITEAAERITHLEATVAALRPAASPVEDKIDVE